MLTWHQRNYIHSICNRTDFLSGAGNLEGLSKINKIATGNIFGYADDWGYGTRNFLDKNHFGVDLVRSSTGEVIDNMKLFKKAIC